MKQVKSGIDLEIKNSLVTYQNAVKTMESQKANMELSAKVARVTKIKYEQGVGSNIEVLDAENTLKESQVNYYNALYDALVAKVDLDKAYGKLLPQTQSN
jgi:outer membrane protein TolC